MVDGYLQRVGLFLFLISSPAFADPRPSDFLKKEVIERVLDRQVQTNASLSKIPHSTDPEARDYRFYAAILVGEELPLTRQTLTDYKIYPKIVPFVSRADFQPDSQTLTIEGGVFNYRMKSQVQFAEQGERWIQFRMVGGSFAGMSGDILFEPQGEKGTLVAIRGGAQGNRWPPAMIMEYAAQYVFQKTAESMRNEVEKARRASHAPRGNENGIPQPQSRPPFPQ